FLYVYHRSLTLSSILSFFLPDPAPTEFYTLSLHDALPICLLQVHHARFSDSKTRDRVGQQLLDRLDFVHLSRCRVQRSPLLADSDRKSTRLNSSHLVISYAVFCLKKKKK